MTPRLALVLAAALALAGCRAREITSLQRKEAASVASEAEFAVAMKDWRRAEGLYARAAELCPDVGGTWLNLGVVRVRLGDRNGARSAYKSALGAYEDAFNRDPSNSEALLRQVSVLVILGRADEARKVVDRARAKYPGDWRLREFAESKGVDRLVADPALKSVEP
jgi:tetratricopeptide (TPR) repeat protein